MFNNEKILMVNGKMYSTEDLLVIVPDRYVEDFKKIAFRSTEELSKALMFANCAEQARAYRMPVEERNSEIGLRWFLKNRARS